MAEQQGQERTEEATPRRKEKLREDGKIAKSPDVDAVFVVAAVLGALAWNANANSTRVSLFAERALSLEDADRPMQALAMLGTTLGQVVVPAIIAAMTAGVAAGAIQTRGLFNPGLLKFKPERLNPLPKLKKIVPGKESLTELAKQLLKIIAVGWVVVQVVREASPRFAMLASASPNAGAAAVGEAAVRLALHALAAFAVLAALDFWLAQRKHAEESKMSKQEVKDEMKQEEGDPQMKGRRRQRARELVRQSIAEVRHATALVTNPTHYSIALRYEPEEDAAPVVLAKGVDALAMRMRAEARRHGVPIIENRPLARTLWAVGKIGAAIPFDLYEATAVVIAQVMAIRERRASA